MRSAPWMDPARSGGTSASSRSQAALPPGGALGMPWAVGSGAAATPAGDKAHSSSCSCRLQGDQGEAVEGGVGATGIAPPHPRPEFWGCQCGFGCSLADPALPGRRLLPASALLSPALPRQRGESRALRRGAGDGHTGSAKRYSPERSEKRQLQREAGPEGRTRGVLAVRSLSAHHQSAGSCFSGALKARERLQ